MRSIYEVVNIGGNATRTTFTAENSTFIGRLQIDHFTSDFRQLVSFSSDSLYAVISLCIIKYFMHVVNSCCM